MTHQLDEKEIFDLATSLRDRTERNAYLDSIGRSNPTLRQRVEALLAAHESHTDFLAAGAPVDDLGEDSIPGEVKLGVTIGRYKILEQIGEGGFGDVYMAEQLTPIQRRVALKIIKAGMDSRQVIARFEAERQALALMDHPHIAKVLDAGATEIGRPYFVMELVRGDPVTTYCDDRSLSIEERLHVFQGICLAVQHAHQKGIIHRDIKPNNILVSTDADRPVPKVIDFGIAKATQGRLTDKTLFTQFRQFVGTPAYMSPEQAQMSNVDVDSRSDIYSLGVLLYELLTGDTPLKSKELLSAGFEEVCRRIREEEAFTPSKRISSLQQSELKMLAKSRQTDAARFTAMFRGDIDWIVMKAIEKDRNRRYASVDALAEDIQRHLHGEPVSAAPPSALYILRRFVGRHRRLLATVGVIAAVLVLGTVISTWQAIRATSATAKARVETIRAAVAEAQSKQRADELAASEAQMRRNLYVAEMAAAKREFDRFTIRRAQELLEKYLPQPDRPDVRGFEWRWLWNQCHRELFRFTGGAAHDLESGPFFRDLRFSPDGKWLASGATDGHVRLWSLATKKQVGCFEGGVDCNAVDFSPDGHRLLAGFYRSIAPTSRFVWDISDPDSPVEVARLTTGARFLPDGNTIVADTGAEFDLSNNRIREPYLSSLPDTQLWARHYSNDWKTLATNQRIWDVPTRKMLAQFPLHAGYLDVGPVGVAISPVDSNLIATGCPEGVRLWDRDGNQIGQIPGTGGTPLGWLSFSPDGKLLAVRQFAGVVRVFETSGWIEVDSIPVPRPDSSVLFSPVDDNLLVAGGNDGSIRAYDISPMAVPDVSFDHSSEILALKFSPDGRLLVAGAADGSVCFWNVASRTQVFATPVTANVRPGGFRSVSYRPDYVAMSPDSRFVAIAGNETVSVWDVVNWQSWTIPESESTLEKGRDYVAVCFSNDGRLLFACDDSNQRLDVWERPGQGDEFRPVASHSISARCFDMSADGLLAGARPKLKVWTIPDMELVRDSARQQDAVPEFVDPRNLAFSPDGQRLAIADLSVAIIDVSQWCITTRLPHSAPIEHVSWSPDGTRLAASDFYATTRLWDIETHKTLATFRGTVSAFSPDGTILAVGGQGSRFIGDVRQVNRVTLYYAPPLAEIDREIPTAKSD